MSETTGTDIDVDERRDSSVVDLEPAPPVYVDPAPTAGTPGEIAEEIAALRAQVSAQALVINQLAASCDWMVQNLTKVFEFVAAMQNAGGPMAMMKMMSGGNNGG